MDEKERALYIISVAAELAGVHPQTLRIYERKAVEALGDVLTENPRQHLEVLSDG